MNFLTPAEIAVAVCNAGKAKTEMPILKLAMGIHWLVFTLAGANLATSRICDADSYGDLPV